MAPALLAAPATGHGAVQSAAAGHAGDARKPAAHPVVVEGATAAIAEVSRPTDAFLSRAAHGATKAPRRLHRAAKRLRQSDVVLATASAQRVSASCRLAPDAILARALGDVGCVLSTP